MARIPTRFFGPAQVGTTATTAFTVNATEKGLIRQIHVNNPSANAVVYTISIGADAAGTRYMDSFTIPGKVAGAPDSQKDFFCYLPIEPSEVVQHFAGTAATLVVVITGDRIVLG